MSTIVLDTIQDRVSSVSVPASDLRGIWQQIGATQIASSDAAIIFQDGVSYTLPGTWDRLKVVCKNVVAAVPDVLPRRVQSHQRLLVASSCWVQSPRCCKWDMFLRNR